MKLFRQLIARLLKRDRVFVRLYDNTIVVLYGVVDWELASTYWSSKPPQWRFYDKMEELVAVFPEHQVLSIARNQTTKTK